MSEVLSRVQPYIQLEETMKASVNRSLKHDNNEKMNSQGKTLTHAGNQNRDQPAFQEAGIPDSLSESTPRPFRIEHFTPLRLLINEVFNTIKDQP